MADLFIKIPLFSFQVVACLAQISIAVQILDAAQILMISHRGLLSSTDRSDWAFVKFFHDLFYY